MRKILFGIPLVILLLALMVGCAGQTISLKDLNGGPANFRLLLSDEANAIGDFSKLEVTISKFGLLQSGDAGKWIEVEIAQKTFDLIELQGANAIQLWNGALPAGEYSKAFIYVESVKGTLAEGGAVIDIKVPSGKLQISEPFSVAGAPPASPLTTPSGTPEATATPAASPTEGPDVTPLTEFVFDITVVKAGNSGQYLIKPQLMDSGADQEYNEVSAQNQGKNSQGEDEVKFRGTIQAIDNATKIWTVSLGEETLKVDVSNAEIEGAEPAVGLAVKVEGTRTGNDVAASEVEVKKSTGKPDKNLQVEGTISAMQSEKWKITADGAEQQIDVSAAKIHGDPTTGDEVRILGTRDNDTIIAKQVQFKDDDAGSESANGTIKLEGKIKAVNSNLWTVTVGATDQTVDVSGVKISGSPTEGQSVEIVGKKTGDKVIAISIKLE